MPKGYRTYLPEQELLLPPSLRDWLAENHRVYFVSDVVDLLDLRAMYAVYEKEKGGQPPDDPRLKTKLLVYGYCTAVFSSRRIQKRLQEDIPFKVWAAGNEPTSGASRTFAKSTSRHCGTCSSRSWRWRWNVGRSSWGGSAGRNEVESQRQQA
jgi:transposase